MPANMHGHLRSIRSVSVLQVTHCPYHPLKTLFEPLNSSGCAPGHSEKTAKGLCTEVLQNVRLFPQEEER